MNRASQEEEFGVDGAESGSKLLHTVQPHRDLESNWGVDLAKSLEEYLFKICTGDLSAGNDAHFSINFAEAALLLQGSVQVYSRKVEYLYTLVLHALEFISQKRPQDQAEGSEAQHEASSSRAVHHEDNDQFWYSDDIPVEAKNILDDLTSRAVPPNHYVKPPANLVVLEGDCLDSSGDGGELEAYLLATNDLYRDFILLDPCDASVVDEFLKGDKTGEVQHSAHKGTPLTCKARKTFLSPFRNSVGSARKSAQRKNLDEITQSAFPRNGVEGDDDHAGPSSASYGPDNGNCGAEMDYDHAGGPDDDTDSDDEDPWKPLNPHEPGNLKVKPFRKVKFSRKPWARKQVPIAADFPLAKRNGPISPQFTEIWEMRSCARQSQQESQSPPFFEKLRESLIHGKRATYDGLSHLAADSDDGDNGALDFDNHNFEQPDFDIQGAAHMEEVPAFITEQHGNIPSQSDTNEHDGIPTSQTSLEDLCRAHLDSLLASIAESEMQTEMAARVSTWKQRIEHDLEEQDSRPPFDIHEYGERVLDKLPAEGEVMSFGDVVTGQEKHDIARTFSALLQLVNERKVDLDRGKAAGESSCFTGASPFYVRLVNQGKGPRDNVPFPVSKKRHKSPVKKGKGERHRGQSSDVNLPSLGSQSTGSSPPVNGKFQVKISKLGGLRCTPEGKRRRRSKCTEHVDLHSAR
ncbi:hypothetical protein Drorol1_Dr00007838 [Drosera rotundifolia]